jgi:fibronectin-binding autotransporter adhesin
LNKTGLGTLTLNGSNTFTGETVISDGVLQLGNLTALQNSALNYNNQGGTLSFGSLTGTHTKNGSGYLNGAPVVISALNGAQDLTLGGGAVAIGNRDANSTYTGILSGSAALVKNGTGTMTLTGANIYFGDTFVDRGNLIISGTGGLNTSGALYIASGGEGSSYTTPAATVTFMDSTMGNFTLVDIGWGTRSGGNLTIQDTANVYVTGNFDLNNATAGTTNNSNNVVALNGGTLTVGGFILTSVRENHLATLNFNGGLLKPSGGGSGTFLPALSGLTANVQAGGLLFDDQGLTPQIDQPLVHDAALGATPDGGLTKSGSGILILAGNNTYTGTTMINEGSIALSNSGTITMLGAIGGSGNLIQQGAGTAILASPNTYTGTTDVQVGTLSLRGTQATSRVTVSGSAGLSVGAGGASVKALTFDANSIFTPDDGTGLQTMSITNSGGLIVNGPVSINSGALGYTIGTKVLLDYTGSIGGTGGGYSAFSLSTMPVRVVGNLVNNTSNTSIDLNVTALKYPKWNGNVNNGVTGDWDVGTINSTTGNPVTGIQNWKEYSTGNATVYQEALGADAVFFDDTATGLTNVNIPATVTPYIITVNNSSKNYTLSGAGKISGTTSLIKTGSGTLSVINTGGNDYTGGTTISDGVLSFSTGALATTGNITMDGGALQWYAGNTDDVSARLIFVAGKTATLDIGGNNVTMAGALNFDPTVTLVKAGSGTMTLTTTASTFTGNFEVNAGIVAVNAANNNSWPASSALGNSQVAHNIVVNNGGTLRFDADRTLGSAGTNVNTTLIINQGGTVTNSNGVFTTLGPVILNGGTLTSTGGGADPDHQSYWIREGAITVGGSSPSTISGSGTNSGFHLANATTFNVADVTGDAATDLTVSTVLLNGTASTGPYPLGSLIKTGDGTMTVTVNTAYTHNTTVNAGVLDMMDLTCDNVYVTAGSLDAQSITTGTLRIGVGAKVTIKPLPGGGPLSGMTSLNAVPEPSTWAMLVLAALGLGIYRRRSR